MFNLPKRVQIIKKASMYKECVCKKIILYKRCVCPKKLHSTFKENHELMAIKAESSIQYYFIFVLNFKAEL